MNWTYRIRIGDVRKLRDTIFHIIDTPAPQFFVWIVRVYNSSSSLSSRALRNMRTFPKSDVIHDIIRKRMPSNQLRISNWVLSRKLNFYKVKENSTETFHLSCERIHNASPFISQWKKNSFFQTFWQWNNI